MQRATAAGLTWPLPDDLDDAALEARLFARPAALAGARRVVPDWGAAASGTEEAGRHARPALAWSIARRIRRGTAYSQFCERYRQWARALKPSMRQVHRAGEKLFVDFSGKRPHLVDPQTGEEVAVELFVGVLGASGLIYAEATPGQDLPSWIGAHVGMLDVLSGQSRDLGARQFEERRHDGQPLRAGDQPHLRRARPPLWRGGDSRARGATPTDKPKVEVSVQIAQRWILAALRHRTFFTLADLNAAIRERVDAINDRPMKITGVSRRALFEQLDRPALKPLPRTRYELAEWKPCRVNIDYHVEVDSQLLQRAVSARAHSASRRASRRRPSKSSSRAGGSPSHVRLTGRGRFATQVEHMPRAHRAHAEWTPSRLIAWADQSGPATGRFVAGILADRPHPEQGYARASGLMRLGRLHGAGSTRSRLCPRGAAPLLSLSHRRTHSHQPAGPAPARGAGPCHVRR